MFICAEELGDSNKVSKFYSELQGERYQILDLVSNSQWLLTTEAFEPYLDHPDLPALLKRRDLYPNQILAALRGELVEPEDWPELRAERFLRQLANLKDEESLRETLQYIRTQPRSEFTGLFLPVTRPIQIGDYYVAVPYIQYFCGLSGRKTEVTALRGRATGLTPYLVPFLEALNKDNLNLLPIEMFVHWIYLSNTKLATSYQRGFTYEQDRKNRDKYYYVPSFSPKAKNLWATWVRQL